MIILKPRKPSLEVGPPIVTRGDGGRSNIPSYGLWRCWLSVRREMIKPIPDATVICDLSVEPPKAQVTSGMVQVGNHAYEASKEAFRWTFAPTGEATKSHGVLIHCMACGLPTELSGCRTVTVGCVVKMTEIEVVEVNGSLIDLEHKLYRPVSARGPGCVDCQYQMAKAVAATMAGNVRTGKTYQAWIEVDPAEVKDTKAWQKVIATMKTKEAR